MAVFVTGCAGYIGSVLARLLMNRGFEVLCLDALLFGDVGIRDLAGERGFKLIVGDTRTFDPSSVEWSRVEAVVDLAAISQPDPLGRVGPDLFREVNLFGPLRVASLAKRHGVKRYIFASTCSVYGYSEAVISEESKPNPLESYAETKYAVERHLLERLQGGGFNVTVLRIATVYGYSPKMRFDLVVNAMTLSLYKTGRIRVGRPGTQARPVVHVKDVAEAFLKVLEAPLDKVSGEVLNVGSNEQNYRIIDLAHEIGKAIGKPYEIEMYGEPDARSYRVDFTKISRVLNFKARYTVADGAREVYRALEEGTVRDEPYTRVIDWWAHLRSQGAVKPLGIAPPEGLI